MYIAPVDRSLDEAEWRSFLSAQGFGHLVACGLGRSVPVVVPTQFTSNGDQILIHVVARNPIIAALEENERAVLSVAGDWAYIPSGWKAIGDEDPRLGIPTTYYGAVQLTGSAEVVEEPDAVADLLRRQMHSLQPTVPVADPAVVHRTKLSAIHGIILSVDEVRTKFKYGGNVDAPHRDAVVRRLAERDGPGDRSAIEHVRRRNTGTS